MLHNNQTGLSFGSPTNANNVLENIEAQTNHIENLKNQVIQPKKILLGAPGNQPLESAIFLPPNDTYGIYRHTGGKPLGVVGEQFEPMNLQLFLDAILQSFLMPLARPGARPIARQSHWGSVSQPQQPVSSNAPSRFDAIRPSARPGAPYPNPHRGRVKADSHRRAVPARHGWQTAKPHWENATKARAIA